MSTFGVDGSGMSPIWLDDATIEQIVMGDEVEARVEHLAVFARAVEALGDEPVPAASHSLEAVFAAGSTAASSRSHRRRVRVLTEGLSTAAAKVAALGVAAKIALGAGVAAAGVAGAGAGGVLPDQANDRVRGMIETVTPVDFADGSGDDVDPAADHRRDADAGGEGEGRGTDDGAPFGGQVSDDANGTSDGENGVDGDEISDEAPGADNRPTDPGATGLDQAEETPAADNVPAEPGAPAGGAGASGTPPSTVPDNG